MWLPFWVGKPKSVVWSQITKNENNGTLSNPTTSCAADDGRRCAIETVRDPRQWLQQVKNSGNGHAQETTVSPDEEDWERLLMGLRLIDGIRLEEFSTAFDSNAIDELIDLDLLHRPQADRLAATAGGRKVLNAVIEAVAG